MPADRAHTTAEKVTARKFTAKRPTAKKTGTASRRQGLPREVDPPGWLNSRPGGVAPAAMGHRGRMTDDKAAQAREGLLDNIAGKAKEVTGAVTGKDDLVAEGQLQQEEARNRRAAAADEAIADATAKEAVEGLREADREVAAQKEAVRTRAQQDESAVEQQRERERQAAARNAERQEAMGREAAEQRADDLAATRVREAVSLAADATATEKDAAAEKQRLEREAAAAEQQAARLRAQTEK